MSKRDELVKAVDDAYLKILEAEETYDLALTVLEHYDHKQEKGNEKTPT